MRTAVFACISNMTESSEFLENTLTNENIKTLLEILFIYSFDCLFI